MSILETKTTSTIRANLRVIMKFQVFEQGYDLGERFRVVFNLVGLLQLWLAVALPGERVALESLELAPEEGPLRERFEAILDLLEGGQGPWAIRMPLIGEVMDIMRIMCREIVMW